MKKQIISYITEENSRGHNPTSDEIVTALGLPMQKAYDLLYNDLSANGMICQRGGWVVCSTSYDG